MVSLRCNTRSETRLRGAAVSRRSVQVATLCAFSASVGVAALGDAGTPVSVRMLGDTRMNHVVDRNLFRADAAAPLDQAGPAVDPLRNVAAAVEVNLALAHEQGRADQVKLLHAVLGLLGAARPH